VFSITQSNNAMADAYAATNRMAALEAEAADRAARADYAILDNKAQEVAQAAEVDKQQLLAQARAARARALVTAGESGIAGNSVLTDDVISGIKTSIDLGTVTQNKENALRQIQNEKSKVYAEAQGRFNDATARQLSADISYKPVSGWASGLQIGTSALNGAVTGYKVGNYLGSKK
jgi:hypothetical protein